ncbi:hypothetical protein [Sideroxydans lithotrophicus]|uniref:Restriction endonuclease type IV Mrr domain-containing protein n=1 Tax=Sideroxydans lithotrophicus (strain ES-1) TaxID=580332 RepID=D5CN74_SIDLE|nr:hypothetical protein [Sideroxydans lithotrophicus]ADE12771.1 hypothetical protein Slit_2546 [Sideroxydans lithotrophicus ES-1]
MKSRPKKSREFELLTSRIEGALAPTGARIKSPDRIKDKITGQLREVDVSIRYTVGSVELLITIECRDRSRIQDVTWIEQIATKRAHIGADRTIAVSSTGFTDAAIRAANAHGISIRLISEITDEDLRSLIDTLEVTASNISIDTNEMALTFMETPLGSSNICVKSRELWDAMGLDAPIFFDANSQSPLSLIQLLSRAQSKPSNQLSTNDLSITLQPKAKATFFIGTDPLSPYLRDVPNDGTPTRVSITIGTNSENISVNTDSGLRRLKQIAFVVTATSTAERVPARRIGQYAAEDKVVTQFSEHQFQIDQSKSLIIHSHKAGQNKKTPTDDKGET